MAKPLFKGKVRLERFPGKGGWTYARLRGVKGDPHSHFGWIRVRGNIDSHELRQYHLMPMGTGELFLPVKAAVRKQIGKKEGDMVQVLLYREEEDVYIPEELQLCLEDDPEAADSFQALSKATQRHLINYIFSIKQDTTRAERIAMLMNNGWRKQTG